MTDRGRSSQPRTWLFPFGTAALAVSLAMLAASDARWHALFDYRRNDIAAGRWWQLATGHLMHWSTAHAGLDAAATLLVAWIFTAALSPAVLAGVSVAAAVVIDAALWFLHPEIARYVGLSGVLHGWFAAGAVVWLLATGAQGDAAARRWGLALCVGLIAKLVVEGAGRPFWLADAAFPVVTAAHRWGAAAGAACGVVLVLVRRRRAAAAGASRPRSP